MVKRCPVSKKPGSTCFKAAMKEILSIEKRLGQKLDEPGAAPLLAALRHDEVLDDSDWAYILEVYESTVKATAPTPRRGTKHGKGRATYTDDDIVNLNDGPYNVDEDDRNAGWLRIMGVWRITGYRIPDWTALWLLRIGHSHGKDFWKRVGAVAKAQKVAPFSKKG